jgi:iron complex transport system ATP-binding protein
MSADASLVASAVTFSYDQPLLRDISLRVVPGQCVALIGANGAGKTTLLRILGGLLSPDSGVVRFDGREIASLSPVERTAALGYLPQRSPRAAGFAVHEMVLMGLYSLLPARGWEGRAEWLAVGRALRRVGAGHLLRRSFATLSGGEQRRVLLARALVARPAILLLDEPLAALDPGFVLEFTATLAALKDQGVALVVSTHRLSFVQVLADAVLVLQRGRVLDHGDPATVLQSELLNVAYGTQRFTTGDPA